MKPEKVSTMGNASEKGKGHRKEEKNKPSCNERRYNERADIKQDHGRGMGEKNEIRGR